MHEQKKDTKYDDTDMNIIRVRIKVVATGKKCVLMEREDPRISKLYERPATTTCPTCGQTYSYYRHTEDTRTEEEKVQDKIHRTDDGRVGFPTAGFFKGMIEVAPELGFCKTDIRNAIRMMEEIAPIQYSKMTHYCIGGF